jgi:hypothetical protein
VYLSSVGIMISVKEEQRVNVKFIAKLGKSATETYNLLTEVYGDERQSIHWKSPTSPRKRKALNGKSNLNAMIASFYIQLITLIGCLKVRPLTRYTIRRFSQPFMNR